jgi:hypothetical protein
MPDASSRAGPLIPYHWSRWLAANRMLGVSDATLVEIAADAGVSEFAARAEIARLSEDPCFEAGRWIGGRHRKLEALLTIREQLRTLAPSATHIERRRAVSPSVFLLDYYSENRPLVLVDFAETWPARHWTVESLLAVLGDEPVEVMQPREADDHYNHNADLNRSLITFSTYVERAQAVGRPNDGELAAINHALDEEVSAALWNDFDAGKPPLDATTARGKASLWFGPAGTVTPLHHDLMNILFVQLSGRKRFTLISPAFTTRVYNEVGVYAEVDPVNPDYANHPEFRGVPTIEVILEPGEALFLPVGWWHRVEALDTSISLSFINFLYHNEFCWQEADHHDDRLADDDRHQHAVHRHDRAHQGGPTHGEPLKASAGQEPDGPSDGRLCIGMATFDEFDGVYFTIQSLRLVHPEILAETTFLILDNCSDSACGEALRDLAGKVPGVRYVPFSGYRSTAVRDLIFRESTAEIVLCVDSHVLIRPGGIRALVDYFTEHPQSVDVVQGPLLGDDLENVYGTHFAPRWARGMYGDWEIDERYDGPDGEPFEIGMQGLGVFACRREAWPGINPRFRGFGGEEGYLQEKFRRNGGRAICLPALGWGHRFHRPGGLPYPAVWQDRIRNYYVGWHEVGWATDGVDEHFREHLYPGEFDDALSLTRRQLESPLMVFDAILCVSPVEDPGRMTAAQETLAAAELAWRVERLLPPESGDPARGELLSFRAAVATARHRGYGSVLIAAEQDDCLDRSLVDVAAAVADVGTATWDLVIPAGGGGLRTTGVNGSAFERLLAELPAHDGAEIDAFLSRYATLDGYLGQRIADGAYATAPTPTPAATATRRSPQMSRTEGADLGRGADAASPLEMIGPQPPTMRSQPGPTASSRRAIVCFVEDRGALLQQALALRESLLFVGCPDTDLVVMGSPEILAALPEDVVGIEQRTVADDPEWFGYRYANDIAALNGANADLLDRYTHLLRADVDTFITPAWRDFRPAGFVCGYGGYSNDDDVPARLRAIASELGLTHRGMTNCGSTWYGPAPLVRRVAALTEMLTRYIYSRHFQTDPGEWPGWYGGVSLLYAAEIAINHCAPDAVTTPLLDHSSTEDVPVEDVVHIHCWHTADNFSKFAFMNGGYADTEPGDLGRIPDYCLEMAMRARTPTVVSAG